VKEESVLQSVSEVLGKEGKLEREEGCVVFGWFGFEGNVI